MAAPNRKLLGNTIAREQFLLNEARIMAQLRLEGMSADEAARKVKEENLFRYPTERSLGRITLACNRRLDALGDARLVRIVAYGMPDAAAQTNLYAMMQDVYKRQLLHLNVHYYVTFHILFPVVGGSAIASSHEAEHGFEQPAHELSLIHI